MTVPLFWHHSDNFGDALAPWLVRKISGKEPDNVDWRGGGPVPNFVTGSIFSHQITRGIIWGAGAAFEADLDPSKLHPPSDDLKIVATRGPLSKALVEQAGHTPVTAGDPVLLLPLFYTPKPKPRQSLGIICSWVDHSEVHAKYGHSVPVVNASSPVEDVIDVLASWDVVVSSCLHGLVAAVAYGKPVAWVEFSDRMMGDGFKFRDFFATFDLKVEPIRNPDLRAMDLHFVHPSFEGSEELYACCPFAPR